MEPLALGVMLAVGENPRDSLGKVRKLGAPTAQMGRPPEKYLAGEGREELKRTIDESGVEITAVFCGYEGESYADIPTVRRLGPASDRRTRQRAPGPPRKGNKGDH